MTVLWICHSKKATWTTNVNIQTVNKAALAYHFIWTMLISLSSLTLIRLRTVMSLRKYLCTGMLWKYEDEGMPSLCAYLSSVFDCFVNLVLVRVLVYKAEQQIRVSSFPNVDSTCSIGRTKADLRNTLLNRLPDSSLVAKCMLIEINLILFEFYLHNKQHSMYCAIQEHFWHLANRSHLIMYIIHSDLRLSLRFLFVLCFSWSVSWAKSFIK